MKLLIQLCAVTLATAAQVPFLGGADLVSYFALNAEDTAVIGEEKFSTTYTSSDLLDPSNPNPINTTFYFSSQENLDAFTASPSTYLPAYGGFCAYGVAFESIDAGGWPWSREYVGPPGTPDIWKIDDDNRLYIAFIPGAMEGFFNDWPKARDIADARWKSWWGEGEGPFNTDCLGPPDTWALHSCSNKPQTVPGVTTIPVVNDDCITALTKYCGDKAPANPDIDILSGECDECIDDNSRDLLAGGCPANTTTGYLSDVVDKYYCK